MIVLSLALAVAVPAALPAQAEAVAPVPVILATTNGGSHTCALTASGGVMCWGANGWGQLGDGTLTSHATPKDVPGLTQGVVSIEAGENHTCALLNDGGLKCWGRNSDGQLGDGSTIDRPTPVDVLGLTEGVVAVAAGGQDTCALTTSGGVKCWGFNMYGEVGDGSVSSTGCGCVPTPTDVSSLQSDVAAISVGGAHSCALGVEGGVKCWGDNYWGAIGDGSAHGPQQCDFWGTPCSPVPDAVVGLSSGVDQISTGGDHTCALMASGGLRCWGGDDYGQLGDGATVGGFTRSTVPIDVPGMSSGVAAVSAGGLDTCALSTGGGLMCWGDNSHGQAGIGTVTLTGGCECVPSPTAPLGLTRQIAAVSAGSYHVCATTVSGGVRCWGGNNGGQLGDGTTLGSSRPVRLFSPAVGDHQSFVSGTHVDASGRMAVTATWAGDDPYGVITGYEARLRIKQEGWTDVPLKQPLATSVTLVLDPSRTYEFDIRVTDSRGLSGVWSPVGAFRLNGSQETPAQYRGPAYTGAWMLRAASRFWGGDVESSAQGGDTVAIKFDGDTFEWIGTRGPEYGSADIYVGRQLVATVDCHSASTMTRQVLWRVELPPAHHMVTIVNDGTSGGSRIDFDGFLWTAPRPPYTR